MNRTPTNHRDVGAQFIAPFRHQFNYSVEMSTGTPGPIVEDTEIFFR